jgi:hypothetical protein
MKEKFTTKEVAILIIAIVAGIAFLETSHPLWTGKFWREFILKVVVYGVVVEFILLGLAQFGNRK